MTDRSAINVLSQVIEVDNVRDIVVTDIATDPDTGLYVRVLRVKGEPDTGAGAPVVFELRLLSGDREALNISVPELEF